MEKLDKVDIKRVHNKLLEMGKIICKFREENDIPYFIAYGTLLGAVRHKGFIPWDDDFDIFLFDDSYQKAVQILRENLPDDLFVEDIATEPLYFHSWVHVKDKKSIAICEQFSQDNIYRHKGLYVDLYCVYRLKDKEIDLFALKERYNYQNRRYKSGLISQEELIKIQNEIETKIILEQKRVESNPSELEAYGTIFSDRVMYIDEIFPLKKYKFEDTEFYGPYNSDAILKRYYGEYTQLPILEDRATHFSSVEFLE